MINKKKIIFIITQMESGGAQIAALRLAQEARKKGFSAETWFLYNKTNSLYDNEFVRCLFDRPLSGYKDFINLLSGLIRAIKEEKPDAIITFTHYANVIAQPIAAYYCIPTRIASQRNPYESFPKIAKILDKIWGSLSIYTHNTCVSNSVADSFKDHPASYKKKIEVIPNGLPVMNAIAERDVRREFELNQSAAILLAVGRLKPQKNHVILVRALPFIKNAQLVIAGEGPLRSELTFIAKDLGISDRVHLLGEVDRSTIDSLLKSADCFLMPSIYEGMSNALLEAVQAKKCIIASDTPSLQEVIMTNPENPCGLLVHADDVEAWASAINSILSDSSLREYLTHNAERSAVKYSISNSADRFLSLVK